MATVAGSRSHVLSLYKAMLRYSQRFPDYNYRLYAKRRIQDGFRLNKTVTDNTKLRDLLKSAQDNLEMIQRQVIIGNLYKDSTLIIEKLKKQV
jgi:hypothetical protein